MPFAGKRWPCRTLWPRSASMTSWLSWTTSTAASPWRTTSCYSTTSARSRGTCRSARRLVSCLHCVAVNFIIGDEPSVRPSSLQDRFQEDPVSMAMIISRNLKEEQKILATAKSAEVKQVSLNFNSSDIKKNPLYNIFEFLIDEFFIICYSVISIHISFCLSVQEEGEGTMPAMVVEKRKLDIKVKELKDRVQVRGVTLVLASGSKKMLQEGRKKKKREIINGPASRLNFRIRWRIKASRTWKISRMSITSRSTR